VFKGKEEIAQAVEAFAKELVMNYLPLGKGGYRTDLGFVMTNIATVQAPHRDYQGYGDIYFNDERDEDAGSSDKRNITKPVTAFLPWILHCPVVEEGMFLNYWPDSRKDKCPIRIHIPFGTYLLTRVDAVHGGIFGQAGNIRLHIAFSPLQKVIAQRAIVLKKHHPGEMTDEVIEKFRRLGAPEYGMDTRKLDSLNSTLVDKESNKCECNEYYVPNDIDDCEEYKITYEDMGYKARFLARNKDWDPSCLGNVKNQKAQPPTPTPKKNNKETKERGPRRSKRPRF